MSSQEGDAEKALEALKEMQCTATRVRRDGKWIVGASLIYISAYENRSLLYFHLHFFLNSFGVFFLNIFLLFYK